MILRMKGIIFMLLFLVNSVFIYAQTNADILGEWYNSVDNVMITLFEEGKTVSGKITWMKSPDDEEGNLKTDLLKNPNEELRKRAKVGMVILSGFAHIAGKVWDNGKLYNPEKGETYSGMMTLRDTNTLYLRGYIGFSFIERSSSIWTRNLDIPKKAVSREGLLSQLRVDLNQVIKLVEDISLNPAKEVIKQIEQERLLAKLKKELKKIIEEIESLKQAE